jgi:hypothetical protein
MEPWDAMKLLMRFLDVSTAVSTGHHRMLDFRRITTDLLKMVRHCRSHPSDPSHRSCQRLVVAVVSVEIEKSTTALP